MTNYLFAILRERCGFTSATSSSTDIIPQSLWVAACVLTACGLIPGWIFGWGWGDELQPCRGFLSVLCDGVLQLLYRGIPSPDLIDGRINQQFENKGSKNAADHR